MISIKDILHGIPVIDVIGSLEIEVGGVCFDSRDAVDGCLFIAKKGTQTDGHGFIEQAIRGGATAVVCENIPDVTQNGVTYVKVTQPSLALGIAASNFYGNPSTRLRLVGITGTNGKTTVATLLYNLFDELGYS